MRTHENPFVWLFPPAVSPTTLFNPLGPVTRFSISISDGHLALLQVADESAGYPRGRFLRPGAVERFPRALAVSTQSPRTLFGIELGSRNSSDARVLQRLEGAAKPRRTPWGPRRGSPFSIATRTMRPRIRAPDNLSNLQE